MIDTLNVVTKTMPDTLRIILSSADKPDFWSHYSPLIVALVVVAISSFIQWYNAYKQRKLELYKIDDLAWLEVLQDLVVRYMVVLHKIDIQSDTCEIYTELCANDIDYNLTYFGLLLHLDRTKENQEKLKKVLKIEVEEIIESTDREKQKQLIINHADSVYKLFHKIADKV